ncbi:MAG: cysteine desulfurase family protein [Patescibacteria group bacterium]
MKKRTYFDYAASTPIRTDVLSAMRPYFSAEYGNAGSLHSFGQRAIAAVDESREALARALGAEFRNVIFTGSATEANNLALRGAVKKWNETHGGAGKKPHIIISAIEHESVRETAKDIAKEGVEVTEIRVDSGGLIDPIDVRKSMTPETILVSIMYANNEIGTIEPIKEIGKVVAGFRSGRASQYPLFHVDAVQAFQFLFCDVNELGADFLTLSAHKIYGPKGIGALYVRDLDFLFPIITGGGQEFGLRSGTENVAGIVGFAKAVELATKNRKSAAGRAALLADRLMRQMLRVNPNIKRHGPRDASRRLPNILNMYIPGVRADELITQLDLKGIAISAGSACKARSVSPSHVFEAIGVALRAGKESVRISVGAATTAKEIETFLQEFKKIFRSYE